ncbi:MAG: sugar ABC transporter substrate-binding protein [Thermoprotei archaeon]|nr:MAG: sugar ABC transporter substrate-binding protein [Thermoprotei archaeon]RLF22987.1 MAG: sugar ABC transporter substrate-binding protein [Thermoprotei archaeon]
MSARPVTAYIVVSFIIGLLIGAGIGWFVAPKGVPAEEYERVKSELESIKPLYETLKELIPEDLAKAKGEIVIKAWPGAKAYDKYRLENLKDAAELLNHIFEALGIGVRIKFKGEVESATLERVVAAYKAGELPDILGAGHEWIGPFAEAGYIIPLDDYIKKYEILLRDWFPYGWAWESMKWKGKVYGILQDTEARPFYFRKDVLRKLGWSEEEIEALPEKIRRGEWTIEDAIRVAKEAVAKGLVKWGFYHRPTPGAQPMFVFYIQFGGKIGDPETGKLIFDKSAWLETLKLFYRIAYEEKLMPPMAGMSWRTVHVDFVNGRVLFWFGGTWHWAEYQRVPYHEELGTVPEDWLWENIGFALVPAPRPGLRPATNTHPWAFMISSQSKYPELAFLICVLATMPTFDVRHCLYGGKLPARSTTYAIKEFKENKFLSSCVYMHEYTSVLFNHPKMPSYIRLVFEAVTAVEKGTPPEKALEDLIKAIQAEIPDIVIVD